jgi:hypothetical protein
MSPIKKGGLPINLKTIIVSVITVCSLITGIFTIDNRYARSGDIDKLEIQLVQTLKSFKKEVDRDRLEQRYLNLTDQAMQMKLFLKKTPDDQDLKDDYNSIVKEKDDVKKKLEDLKVDK